MRRARSVCVCGGGGRGGGGDRMSGWRRAGGTLVFFRETRARARLRTSLDCEPTFKWFLHRDSWKKLVPNGLILEARCKCAAMKYLQRHSIFYLVKCVLFGVRLDTNDVPTRGT